MRFTDHYGPQVNISVTCQSTRFILYTYTMFLIIFDHFTGELLGALCTRKGPAVFVACQDEIVKSVSDNLERKLLDPEEVAEGLVHKLTGEKEIAHDTVSTEPHFLNFSRETENCL